jgi:hypothetical protein
MIIFNFNCSLCGATPEKQDFETYLANWGVLDYKQTFDLLEYLYSVFCELLSQNRIDLPINLLSTIGNLRQMFSFFLENGYIRSIHVIKDIDIKSFQFFGLCPICGTAPGIRGKGRYFGSWDSAKIVQIANILYETDIILWHVLKKLPNWATGDILSKLNEIRKGLQLAAESTELLKCPKCGRFTTCLYGEKDNFCRWCYDNKGGGPILRINLNHDFVDSPNDLIEIVPPPDLSLSKEELKLIPPFLPLSRDFSSDVPPRSPLMEYTKLLDILRTSRDVPSVSTDKDYLNKSQDVCMSLFSFFREIIDLVNSNIADLFFNSIDYQYFDLIRMQNTPFLLFIRYKPSGFKDIKSFTGYEFGLYGRVYRGSRQYNVDTYVDVDLPLSELEYTKAAKRLLTDFRTIIQNLLIMGDIIIESPDDGELKCTDKRNFVKLEKYLSTGSSIILYAKMSSDHVHNFFGFSALTILFYGIFLYSKRQIKDDFIVNSYYNFRSIWKRTFGAALPVRPRENRAQ